MIGPETPAVPGLDTPLATRQVAVTEKATAGSTIAELERDHHEFRRDGVYITDVLRNDQHLPASAETQVERGDVLTLVGARAGLNKLVAKIASWTCWPRRNAPWARSSPTTWSRTTSRSTRCSGWPSRRPWCC